MRVSALYVYPIKSCRGAAARALDVGELALANDRRFMVVAPDGAFLTQRQAPRMAWLEAHVEGRELGLRAPERDPIDVATTGEGETKRVEVWGAPCDVVDQGDAVAAWLTDYLGIPARLVGMADGYRRSLHEKLASAEHDVSISFADAAPFLVIGEASLADLNARLDTGVPMDRFRPNLVVEGGDAYAEDAWDRVRVGQLELRRLMPCARCSITTTDQATLERGKEPLRTLATYRKDPEHGVLFGTYYAPVGTGRLAVGDEIRSVPVSGNAS